MLVPTFTSSGRQVSIAIAPSTMLSSEINHLRLEGWRAPLKTERYITAGALHQARRMPKLPSMLSWCKSCVFYKSFTASAEHVIRILFAFTTAATIFWIFKNRRSGGAGAASTSSPAGNTAQQPGALQPTPAPGYQAPDGQGTTQIPGTQQGASYPLQQTQPQMQQSGYSEPTQQSTYPTNKPQGSASEYYSPPQSQPERTNYPPNRAEMPSPPPQQHGVSPIAGH